ncbi:F0F1 ATP synthase subunit epsilon [Nocardioides sp. YIM 152315]|uniref:F0F1 ATP synthase subunit epsilon n=1 Tax=Nocardioides sp. YIM 152315 TaxID=3031760 RepID=UPI0023DC169E|nr:F0F1 ATP synthase subunit epsilon [Nocardioides sp. YIM 152315]MDF1603766.1 F0F1 ATP synthase subunit epsilon [Nocardioides sp. YIM 152315]
MADNDQLQVELVAADRTVWSGQATMIIAKTADGDIGVLRNHMPVLSLLVDGVISVDPVDGDRMYAAVDGGFLSVANNRVSILAQYAALADEIDVEAARAEFEAAQGEDSDEAQERARRAEARIRAVEKAS